MLRLIVRLFVNNNASGEQDNAGSTGDLAIGCSARLGESRVTVGYFRNHVRLPFPTGPTGPTGDIIPLSRSTSADPPRFECYRASDRKVTSSARTRIPPRVDDAYNVEQRVLAYSLDIPDPTPRRSRPL